MSFICFPGSRARVSYELLANVAGTFPYVCVDIYDHCVLFDSVLFVSHAALNIISETMPNTIPAIP